MKNLKKTFSVHFRYLLFLSMILSAIFYFLYLKLNQQLMPSTINHQEIQSSNNSKNTLIKQQTEDSKEMIGGRDLQKDLTSHVPRSIVYNSPTPSPISMALSKQSFNSNLRFNKSIGPSDDEPPSDFIEMAQKVRESIPSRDFLRNLSTQEAHHTPNELHLAAFKLAEFKQMLVKNPTWNTHGLTFYRECVEEENYPNSIRASCYLNFIEFAKKSEDSELLISTVNVSETVKSLAQKLL